MRPMLAELAQIAAPVRRHDAPLGDLCQSRNISNHRFNPFVLRVDLAPLDLYRSRIDRSHDLLQLLIRHRPALLP